MDPNELSESGGVVVPCSLGISVGLQNWVGGHNLVLKGDLLGFLFPTASSGHHGQVGDHLLGVLGLSGTRLTGDQHCIVLLVLDHVPVGSLRNGPEVRGAFVPPEQSSMILKKTKDGSKQVLMTQYDHAKV